MNAEYSVEKVRARLDFVVSDREPRILTWESGGCHPASIAECALWDALAERIEAGEAVGKGLVPAEVGDDDAGLPAGFADWYNRTFRGQHVDNARLENCERAWRRALAAPPRAVPDARIIDLAERLVAPGPRAAHVSASECHEISEFILSLAAPSIDAPDSKP